MAHELCEKNERLVKKISSKWLYKDIPNKHLGVTEQRGEEMRDRAQV